MIALIDYRGFYRVFSRHTLYYNRADYTLDNCFDSCLACWKGCNWEKSDLWRCFAGNTCWTNYLYFIVVFLVGYFLGAAALIFGYILAFIAWIWGFKESFQTGWLRAILTAILAWIIFILLSIIIGALFGIVYPAPFSQKSRKN